MVDEPVPSSGALQGQTAGELLEALAAEQRTGLLRFDGNDARIVCLAAGQIYLATSASGPSIHQIVVGSGAVPEAAWADASASGAGLTDQLADDERVDADRLATVLHEHTVSTVVELLAEGPDSYELVADQEHHLGTRFTFAVEEVLADAELRLTTWRTISGTLPSTSTHVRRSPTLPRGTTAESLSAVEWQVVMSMPADGTVADVIAASGLSAFTVFDVLHRLVRRGLVQPSEAATDPA